MKRAFVFDLGGTLINYEGLPLYWGDFYKQAFQNVNSAFRLRLTEEQIEDAVFSLKEFNPRLYPREIEYSPEYIFSKVTKTWNVSADLLESIIDSFFDLFRGSVSVFPDTMESLKTIKEMGFMTGILTDVPTGMPTKLVLEDILTFEGYIDCFLSSNECGYRKPNKMGLEMIAKKFQMKVEQIIFVGDESKDIKTAQNAGAFSILINRKNEKVFYGEDLQIRNLLELKDIGNQMFQVKQRTNR